VLAAGPSPAVGFATVRSPQEMQGFFESRSTGPGSAGSPKPAARRRQRCVRPWPMAFGLGGRLACLRARAEIRCGAVRDEAGEGPKPKGERGGWWWGLGKADQ
jgi:hypothetical protein